MTDQRKFDANGDEVPMFESIEDAGAAFGWSREQTMKVETDMILSERFDALQVARIRCAAELIMRERPHELLAMLTPAGGVH